ncbi:hypothetical protein D3C84_1216940 [compost metagenome]
MRAAHDIAAHVNQNIEILQHQLRRESKSPLRMLLMPIYPLKIDLLPIQQYVAALHFNRAEARPINKIVLPSLNDKRI